MWCAPSNPIKSSPTQNKFATIAAVALHQTPLHMSSIWKKKSHQNSQKSKRTKQSNQNPTKMQQKWDKMCENPSISANPPVWNSWRPNFLEILGDLRAKLHQAEMDLERKTYFMLGLIRFGFDMFDLPFWTNDWNHQRKSSKKNTPKNLKEPWKQLTCTPEVACVAASASWWASACSGGFGSPRSTENGRTQSCWVGDVPCYTLFHINHIIPVLDFSSFWGFKWRIDISEVSTFSQPNPCTRRDALIPLCSS